MCRVPVVRQSDEGGESHREVFIGQFGLMPFWAKDPTVARRTYNARSETADTKPNFRDAWRRGQRCIIPAECVYLPHYDETGKAARWQVARADGALGGGRLHDQSEKRCRGEQCGRGPA